MHVCDQEIYRPLCHQVLGIINNDNTNSMPLCWLGHCRLANAHTISCNRKAFFAKKKQSQTCGDSAASVSGSQTTTHFMGLCLIFVGLEEVCVCLNKFNYLAELEFRPITLLKGEPHLISCFFFWLLSVSSLATFSVSLDQSKSAFPLKESPEFGATAVTCFCCCAVLFFTQCMSSKILDFGFIKRALSFIYLLYSPHLLHSGFLLLVTFFLSLSLRVRLLIVFFWIMTERC